MAVIGNIDGPADSPLPKFVFVAEGDVDSLNAGCLKDIGSR
jgi:hypothetical protein